MGIEKIPNVVYNMDCLEGMKLMDDNTVDFVLTDPPFNLGIDYGTYKDDMSDDDYSAWCLKWIGMLYKVLKDNHYCIIFSGDKKIYWVLKAIYGTDFRFHHFLKWNKPQGQGSQSGTVLFNRTELAVVLSKGKPNVSSINRRILFSDTIVERNTMLGEAQDGFQFDHPATRPTKLYRKIIEGFTQKDDIVFDPFMGSGTTAVVCKQLERNFIGFELNPSYVKIINKRLGQKILGEFEA